jgi:hypothetical protein
MEAIMWREPLQYEPPSDRPTGRRAPDDGARRAQRATPLAWALVALAAIAIVVFLF